MAWYVQLKTDGNVGVFYYDGYGKRIVQNFERGDFSEYMRCGNATDFGKFTLKEFKQHFVTGRDPAYIFDEEDGLWYYATGSSQPELVNMKNIS